MTDASSFGRARIIGFVCFPLSDRKQMRKGFPERLKCAGSETDNASPAASSSKIPGCLS